MGRRMSGKGWNAGRDTDTNIPFHVTIAPGSNGVPEEITDIVVKNNGRFSAYGDKHNHGVRCSAIVSEGTM